MQKEGITLFEFFIISIFIIILVAVAVTFIKPLERIKEKNDAKRKSDLKLVQTAVEEYYDDFGFYPQSKDNQIAPGGEIISWGQSWPVYLPTLPKDPSGSRKYVYVSNRHSYYLYANLEIGRDPEACPEGKCKNAPRKACGDNFDCNYGLSSLNTSR